MSTGWNDRLYRQACEAARLDARGYHIPAGRVAVADASTALILRNAADQPKWVVTCSASGFTGGIDRAVEQSQTIRQRLSAELAAPILRPLYRGILDHRDFAVYAYCRPIRLGRFHPLLRRTLRRRLFGWLRQFSKQTLSELSSREVDERFRLPLDHLAQCRHVSETARQAAKGALRDMDDRTWRPRHVAMHNDLWLGNILWDTTSPADKPGRERNPWGFVIIDWSGAMERGYGIYDLVRLAGSLRAGRRHLKRELIAHCEILGCQPRQAQWHLAAALGHMGLHLEQFPLDRYAALVERTLIQVREALPART